MTSKLDQIEQILAQTALMQQAHAEAITRIDTRLDRFAEETERRLAAMETSMDNLSRQVDNTACTVDAVGLTLENSIRHAEVDRAEIKRIWQYLMRQTPNGDSPTS